MVNFLFQAVANSQLGATGAMSSMGSGLANLATGFARQGSQISAHISKMAQGASNQIKTDLKLAANAAQAKASTIAASAAGMARNSINTMITRSGELALSAESNAKNLFLQGSMLARIYKTFKFIIRLIRKVWPVLRWIFRFTKLMNTIGVWAFRMIEVMIYRIFHMKSCIFWYILEAIGYMLYIVMEFFVWLLSLQSWETTFWTLVEDFDCLFFSMTNYHIFHYSDQILRKCYAVQIPPLPFKSITFQGDGDFDEKAMLKMILFWMLPPTPQEIGQATKLLFDMLGELSGSVKQTAQANKEEADESYEKAKNDPQESKKAVNSATQN